MSYELSEKQIQEAGNSFTENFDKWAVFRKIFNVIKIEDTRIRKTDDFVTIGFNHIVKRDWFTNHTGSTYYDHTTLGMTRGKGVALGESRYILKQINDIVSKLEVSTHVQKDDIINSIFSRIQNIKNNIAILANPTIISSLLNEDQFKLSGEVNIWGYYHNVPVMWSPVVEKDSIYIINRNAGSIIIEEERKGANLPERTIFPPIDLINLASRELKKPVFQSSLTVKKTSGLKRCRQPKIVRSSKITT